MWFKSLSDDDRKALLILRTFEKVMRNRITGYSVLTDETVTSTPRFRQAKAVVVWLEKRGYKITLNWAHWQGYIRYAVQENPAIFVGQLNNPVLFKRYCSQASFRVQTPVPGRSSGELAALYRRILSPGIRGDAAIELLGLSEFQIDRQSVTKTAD